jgi:hypothetical protein
MLSEHPSWSGYFGVEKNVLCQPGIEPVSPASSPSLYRLSGRYIYETWFFKQLT